MFACGSCDPMRSDAALFCRHMNFARTPARAHEHTTHDARTRMDGRTDERTHARATLNTLRTIREHTHGVAACGICVCLCVCMYVHMRHPSVRELRIRRQAFKFTNTELQLYTMLYYSTIKYHPCVFLGVLGSENIGRAGGVGEGGVWPMRAQRTDLRSLSSSCRWMNRGSNSAKDIKFCEKLSSLHS